MKKSVIFLLTTVIISTMSCHKETTPDNGQTYIRTGFDINFDGKEYIGIDSAKIQTGYTQYKGVSLYGYKNIVTAVIPNNVSFSLEVTNVPDSGIIKTLCDSLCNSANGDAVISYRDGDGNNLTNFSGTVKGISSGEIQINASKNGKVLTGTLKWK